MSDIIALLPDNVANQIAAGEVVQRPASVVKELMENSVDAGSTNIKVNIADAGKTLIQIIDNGCGMSPTDARMAFERHATSKIKNVNDLFAIHTMGFRGEALASIAAVASVVLKTRVKGEELGSIIEISASNVDKQEAISCPEGTNFSIKNLFFNVPARRKFLKTHTTEFKHIVVEFQRVAMAHPSVAFSLHHNNTEVYNLPSGNTKQRIINLFGKGLNQHLVPIENETSLAKIRGFVGKPENAKKTMGEQFFFVNNRYMKHPAFHKAITMAYDELIPKDSIPSYFIYFDVDPSSIDINIHPTKTEIKFEDERSLWKILNAAVKQVLGKSNFMPSIDFNTQGMIDIPVADSNKEAKMPSVNVDPCYNPFKASQSENRGTGSAWAKPKNDPNLNSWENLYTGLDEQQKEITFQSNVKTDQKQEDTPSFNQGSRFVQVKGKYIVTPVKSGLMYIHQHRAHQRILYEDFLQRISADQAVSQQTLFPETIELNAADYALLTGLSDDLQTMGFDLRDFGNNSVVVNGIPANAKESNIKNMIDALLEEFKISENDIKENTKERIARSLARSASIKSGTILAPEEMREIMDSLFACNDPSYSPSGKKAVKIISIEEIDKQFN